MTRWFRSLLAELLPTKVKTEAMEHQPHIDARKIDPPHEKVVPAADSDGARSLRSS